MRDASLWLANDLLLGTAYVALLGVSARLWLRRPHMPRGTALFMQWVMALCFWRAIWWFVPDSVFQSNPDLKKSSADAALFAQHVIKIMGDVSLFMALAAILEVFVDALHSVLGDYAGGEDGVWSTKRLFRACFVLFICAEAMLLVVYWFLTVRGVIMWTAAVCTCVCASCAAAFFSLGFHLSRTLIPEVVVAGKAAGAGGVTVTLAMAEADGDASPAVAEEVEFSLSRSPSMGEAVFPSPSVEEDDTFVVPLLSSSPGGRADLAEYPVVRHERRGSNVVVAMPEPVQQDSDEASLAEEVAYWEAMGRKVRSVRLICLLAFLSLALRAALSVFLLVVAGRRGDLPAYYRAVFASAYWVGEFALLSLVVAVLN